MQAEHQDIVQQLQQAAPFNVLSAEQLATLARHIEVSYYRAHTPIVAVGDSAHHLYYIRSGSVELNRRDGRLHNRLEEKDVFGQLGLLLDGRHRFHVRALEDSLMYLIPKSIFMQMYQQSETFADFMEIEDRARLRQASTRNQNALLSARVGDLIRREPIYVTPNTRIQEAARIMTAASVSSILVVDPRNDSSQNGSALLGIVTDRDLRERVVAQHLPLENPIVEVMTTQPLTIERDDLQFAALLKMLRDNIHHLPVMHRQHIVGVLSLSDLMSQETQHSLFVVSHIFHCTTVAELVALKPDITAAFCRLVQEDANSHMIGAALSAIGRSFKQQLLQLAEAKLGPPPVPYCFLALGSMARDEQLMASDQDNALILSDEFNSARDNSYFAELSHIVSDGLAQLGYAYCRGAIMVTNPKMRLTESTWRQTFLRWIHQPNPQALLLSSIFFDLDGVAGDLSMANRLKSFIAKQASASPHFLGCLARNALNRTPPLGFFRDFVVEKTGMHRDSVNLKRRGTAPLVDVIRVHALAAGSVAQSSCARLNDAVAKGWLTSSAVADLRDAFEFISSVRIRHQAQALAAGNPPTNNLNPEHLSAFERRSLKDAFQVLSRAQKFLKFRYRPGSLS